MDNISFYVTAEEMERLSFAQANGTFYVSLRNPFDKGFMKSKEGYDLERFLMSKNVYESAQPSIEINFQVRKTIEVKNKYNVKNNQKKQIRTSYGRIYNNS